MSNIYSIHSLCKVIRINRSGFYKWLKRRFNPSLREINRESACSLFEDYHYKFPSHGYRWLNAKIKLDRGVVYSNNYAHKICNFLNIILAQLNPTAPFQIVQT